MLHRLVSAIIQCVQFSLLRDFVLCGFSPEGFCPLGSCHKHVWGGYIHIQFGLKYRLPHHQSNQYERNCLDFVHKMHYPKYILQNILQETCPY